MIQWTRNPLPATERQYRDIAYVAKSEISKNLVVWRYLACNYHLSIWVRESREIGDTGAYYSFHVANENGFCPICYHFDINSSPEIIERVSLMNQVPLEVL